MSKSIEYYKTLDSLRAIAALMVVLLHFTTKAKIGSFRCGAYGVDLFFTISGFLITSILLNQRYSTNTISKLKILSNFYIRRSLRIFPIYFLFIFLLFIYQYIGKVTYWNNQNPIIYYLTYTTNFLFFKTGFNFPLVEHLWSLAVEEQFYLLWPWFVIFAKKEHLLYYILAFILTGFFTHIIGSIENIRNIRFLPFANFHTLGIGILLAYLIFTKHRILAVFKKYSTIASIIAVFLFVINVYYIQVSFSCSWIKTLINELIILFFTASLVFRFINTFSGVYDAIFNFKYFVFLGKISYGIYMYHMVIPVFLSSLSYIFGFKFNSGYLYFGLCIVVTVIVSTLSWYFIEQPLLRLKNRFDL